MIHPGAVGRHGRLGILVNTTLVRGLDGRLYYGDGGGGPGGPGGGDGGAGGGGAGGGGGAVFVPLPPRLRKRFIEPDDVLRDDDEILIFIGEYLKTLKY